MGEATRKSRSRREVLDREARCIYCPGPAETWEHMPPVGMFRDRQRPGGMEYGACKSCNEGRAAQMRLPHGSPDCTQTMMLRAGKKKKSASLNQRSMLKRRAFWRNLSLPREVRLRLGYWIWL